MRQTTANAWGQLVRRTSGVAWVDLNAKQVAATIDNSRVVVEAEPQGNFVLLMRITSSLVLYNRACCREVKNPNQYGGVILWCLFMYRIDP